MQGGFLAAMLDDTLGPALATTLDPDQFAVTLDLNVSFLRPAAPATGTGRVVHRGGSIAFLAGELRDATGAVLATATATARIIRPGRPGTARRHAGLARVSWLRTPPARLADCRAPRHREPRSERMVKAVRFSQFGGPEVLEIVDLPDPHPGPGQVRIAVRAAGVNPSDWKKRRA